MDHATAGVIAHFRHLVRRFFEVLGARPLSPAEQAEAARWLNGAETGLFWSQPVADQRHGLVSARVAAVAAPHRDDLVRAALLHDVGKRHSRLGVVGRSLASLLEILHLPTPGRLGRYLHHGPLGAEELAAAGAEPVVTAFAAFHHDARPPGVDAADWAVLIHADHA